MTVYGNKPRDQTRHITNKLNYFKQLQRQLDAHITKQASINLRKEWLEKQKTINYVNEYDRIRGLISQNLVKHQSITGLEHRKKHLESLGVRALDGLN